MLGSSKVEGADEGAIHLPEIALEHLAIAVKYMEFKLNKQNGIKQPRFEVNGKQAVALFRVANYLDL